MLCWAVSQSSYSFSALLLFFIFYRVVALLYSTCALKNIDKLTHFVHIIILNDPSFVLFLYYYDTQNYVMDCKNYNCSILGMKKKKIKKNLGILFLVHQREIGGF